MRYFFLSLYLLILSCSYPDIDSVPDFEDLVITKKESIDLCKLTNTVNKSLSTCLDKIENNQNK